MKPGWIIEVEWIDSCSVSGTWVFCETFNFNEHERGMKFISVGYFVNETQEALFICQSSRIDANCGGRTFGHIFSIPRRAITKTKILLRGSGWDEAQKA